MAYTEKGDFTLIPSRGGTSNPSYSVTDFDDMNQSLELLVDNIVAIIGADATPTRDMETLHTDLDTAETDIDNLQTDMASVQSDIKVCTTTYTILDDDGYGTFELSGATGAFPVTLPTLADNQKRILRFVVTTKGGNITIDGENAETINGLSSIVLSSQYDNLTVIGIATMWMIQTGTATHSTGWINTADWTNREIGDMQITYNNLAGTFKVGELVSESVSGNTWIIIADTGAVLTCRDATGTGFATNARTLTGATSGATATVNGTTKNIDTSITHNMGYNVSEFDSVQLYVSTDGTENNAQPIVITGFGVSIYGWGVIQTSTNICKIQTGSSSAGLMIAEAGTIIDLDTDDYYYKVILRKRW